MNKIKMLGSILGMFLLFGCYTMPGVIGKIPQVDGDFATVFIARKMGIIKCIDDGTGTGRQISGFVIQVNDENFVSIACGVKTKFKIPVGKTTKISSVSSPISDHYYLNPEKGEKIYFGMDCHGFTGACWFAPLVKTEYDQIALTCKESLVIEQGK